ncbi:MAG: M20/M25/M40 family metallo-hydrolase [Thermomicrobiaceae bacterium]|nr:M20/M25/M40 family metallo-hydrolase [Thermomicrobiaceae bacterium]
MASTDRMAEVDRYIEEHVDEFLADLADLCALPSVAAQNRAMPETAEATRKLLEKYGVDALVMPSEGYPMVYGELVGASAKTILNYNHYDVQPAEPFELWDSPPFEATRRDGKLYARGVSDDKGHIVCRLAAIAALRAVYGEVPCSLKFLIEGEEEIGSPSMAKFIEEHADRLKADACLWEFGGVDYEGRPQIFLGMRGDFYVELRVKCLSHDAHSGLGGSIFPNAAWRLVWALNTLKDRDEQILIPGWYDDVREPSPRDLELIAALPDEDERLKESYGLTTFLKDAKGAELRRQQVFVPTCTIAGLASGYQGPGSKTVLPAEAMAKVDFRLVPAQDPQDLLRKLRQHLDDQGFADINVIVHGAYPAAKVDPDDPFVALVAEAGEEVYGKPAAIHPMSGGSGPMDPFVRFLQVPIANAGVGYPNSLAHAPNEHIRIDNFIQGVKHTARVFARMGELG